VARDVHLVRHGETVGRSAERFFGATDIALSDAGRAQVRALAPLLAATRFAAVAHSPLGRAVESAALLLAAMPARPPIVEIVAGFREVDFGRLEGLSEPEIVAQFPDWHATWRCGSADCYPGGEAFESFSTRVATAYGDLLRRHPHGDLLIVAHKGVIKRIVMHALGRAWEELRPLPLELGSRSVLRVGDAGAELVEWNRLP
jgi:broad specificity phosphatase PhoE